VKCGTNTTCFKVPTDTFTYVNALKTLGTAASAGFVRMASAEAINFRNNANNGDVNGISKDAADVVQVGGAAGFKFAAVTPAINAASGNSGRVAESSGALTSGNCAKFDANGNIVDFGAPCEVATAWGGITGTLASQTDLQTALNGKAASSHTHDAADVATGTLAAARLPLPQAAAIGGVQAKTCAGSDKLSAIGTDGIPVCTADQTAAGGGDAMSVNGVALIDGDLDDATPAAPANSLNVRWQKDSATPNNVSANLPYGGGLTANGGNLVVSLTTCEAYRSADLTLTANTYADNVSCSLSAGTWLITTETTVKSPVTTAQKVTVKLWDGTTVYTSGESAAPSQGSGLTGYAHIALTKIITLASTTTVKTTVASTVASVLDAAPDDNGTSIGNTANAIHAVRIGN
jgi:hypothetical protein